MPQRHKPASISVLPGCRLRDSSADPRAPGARAPAPPKWLSAEAKAVWRETARYMAGAGTWAPAYMSTLASFSVLEAMFRADVAEFSAARMAQKRLLAADLGLAPATIARVQKVTPVKVNKFTEKIDRPRRDPRDVLRE